MDIKLVELVKEDIELVRGWRNSPDVSQYMYTEAIISKEQQVQWFDRMSKETDSKYWIIEYNNTKVGLASITGISQVLQSCHWAFYLGDHSKRRAGIGAKVEYNIIEYVFSELKLNKLRCEVFVSNSNVVKMHEKFGFKQEAYYREHCIKGDKKLDVIGLALLKSDWDEIKKSMKDRIYRA